MKKSEIARIKETAEIIDDNGNSKYYKIIIADGLRTITNIYKESAGRFFLYRNMASVN